MEEHPAKKCSHGSTHGSCSNCQSQAALEKRRRQESFSTTARRLNNIPAGGCGGCLLLIAVLTCAELGWVFLMKPDYLRRLLREREREEANFKQQNKIPAANSNKFAKANQTNSKISVPNRNIPDNARPPKQKSSK